jgi:8-oxo-dGTP diphosphatase
MLECTFEKGKKASLRHVVVEAIIVKDNQILLVKRAPELLCGGKYGIIGGFLDRDENIKEGMLREILEETGYIVELKTLFRIKDDPNRPQEDRQNVSFVFIAHPIKKVKEGDDESTAVTWFSFDKLPSKETFAFDHYEDIQLYLKHKGEPIPLPLF